MATQRLRVCHVITGLNSGGAERALLQTIDRLDRLRFESFLVSLRDRAALSERAESLVETVHLGMGKRPGPVTLWRVARLLRRIRPDIVHSYLYDASIAARLAGRWARVPVVLTSTRAPLEYLPRIAWWVDRVTARWCQRVIAVSHHTAEVIVNVEGIPRDKVLVVPNGVDLNRFAPRDGVTARESLALDRGAFVVASVGRLAAEKGHRFLVSALALARAAIPSLVCVLAGDGPEREVLEGQSRALGLDHVCRFLGEVRDVERVLAASDVMVLPSLYEGMPNAALESLAMGCPVIASAVGGSVELIEDGKTGFLVPPAAPAALAKALIVIARSPELRAVMRTTGRRLVEERYGVDQLIATLERLYVDEWARSVRAGRARV